jgi:hypothetical protein
LLTIRIDTDTLHWTGSRFSLEQYLPLLDELDGASIPSRTKAGVIFSRRMVRDAELRAANRLYQTTHRKSLKGKENSKTDVRPMSGVSSSSSSSLKTSTPPAVPARLPIPDFIDIATWNAYEEMRKKKRCPMTDHARQLAFTKLAAFKDRGISPQSVLENSIMGGYQGLFEPSQPKSVAAPGKRVYANA